MGVQDPRASAVDTSATEHNAESLACDFLVMTLRSRLSASRVEHAMFVVEMPKASFFKKRTFEPDEVKERAMGAKYRLVVFPVFVMRSPQGGA